MPLPPVCTSCRKGKRRTPDGVTHHHRHKRRLRDRDLLAAQRWASRCVRHDRARGELPAVHMCAAAVRATLVCARGPGHRACHPVCACAPALSVPRPRCVPVHHRCPGRPACACAPPLSVPPGVRLCATAVRAARCVSVCVCQRTVAVRAARRASVRHRCPCRPACAFCLLAPLRPASPAARARRLCAGRETAARHVSPFPSAAAT